MVDLVYIAVHFSKAQDSLCCSCAIQCALSVPVGQEEATAVLAALALLIPDQVTDLS